MLKLGVNIDHVATLRQARRGHQPDILAAAALAELGGADGITVHLREDRRHIQDADVELLRRSIGTSLNLEMACTPEMISIATTVGPDQVTLVPERRQELTTEGGLDVCRHFDELQQAVRDLHSRSIPVSLFIDPDSQQIDAAARTGARAVELHTGAYANAQGQQQRDELQRLIQGSSQTLEAGLLLHAGHGLDYANTGPIAAIAGMRELNIGHSIVSRAVFHGLERAVRDMRELMQRSALS